MSSNIRVNSITPSVGNNVAIGTAGGTITFNCDTISGIATFANDIDITQKLDVDGHTELDNVNISGVVTAISFAGPLTGNADTASNLTGSPSITVADITASGNVSIAGTLTYEDVTNIDSVGLVTARDGIIVTGGAVGIGTDNPDRPLHVFNGTNDANVKISSTGSGKDARLELIGNSTGTSQIRLGDEASSNVGLITYNHANNSLALRVNSSERLRVDSSGRLLIGTNTARAIGGESNSRLQIEGSGATSNSWVNISRFANNGGSAVIQFGKSRSDTPGTYTVVQNNDTLGSINFAGADGTDLATYGAKIAAEVDGTPGANDMPGRLTFYTTSDGSATLTERLRINSSGQVSIGNNPTVAADAALHIELDGTREYLRLNADAGNNNAYLEIQADDNRRKAVIFKSGGTRRGVIGVGDSDESSATSLFLSASANIAGNDPHMVITSAGRIGVGDDNPDVPFNVKADGASFAGQTTHAKIEDTTSLAANVGGLLAFEGVYNSSGDPAAFAMIHAGKTNADSGNYAGYLRFFTRANGSLPAERLRITSDGHTLFSGLTSNIDTRNVKGISVQSPGGITFKRTGSTGSRNWRLRPDDLSAWGSLEFSVAPTDGSSDIPDAASDVVLELKSNKDVKIHDGNLVIGTSGHGIDFSASGNTGGMQSELLDDYEEGVWTPTLIGSSSNPSLTYATQAGAYEKIGALVHASFFVNVNGVSSQGSGQLRIGGLPFNSSSNINAAEVPAVLLQSEPFTDGDGSNRAQLARTATNTNYLMCAYRELTTGNVPVPTNAAANVGTGYFIGHVTYRTLS